MKKKRKSYVDRRIEKIDKLSDEELLEEERRIYTSTGVTVGVSLVIFVVCIVILMVVAR